MNVDEQEFDRTLDRTLRELGPAMPEPKPEAELRAEVLASVGADAAASAALPEAAPMPRMRLMVRLVYGLAAGFVIVGAVAIWAEIDAVRLRHRVNQLQAAPAPLQSAGSPLMDFRPAGSPRYVAVNLYHERCPRAREMKPYFDQLAGRCRAEPVTFVTLNVESAGCAETARALGVGCIFDERRAGETGTVKIVDVANRRIVLSVDADDGLTGIEHFLAQVGSE